MHALLFRFVVAVFGIVGLVSMVEAQQPKKEAPPKLNFQKIQAAEAALAKAGCIFGREKNQKDPLVGHVRVVNFPDGIKDDAVAKLIPSLKDLPALNAIDVGRSKLTDTGLATFAALPDLGALYLDFTALTDKGLLAFADMKKLYWLDISNTKVTGEGLKTVGKLSGLEHLTLRGLAKIKDDDLAPLAELQWMRDLTLPGPPVTQAGLKHIANMRMLMHLDLGGVKVGDEGAKIIGEFKRLENLTVAGDMTDEGMQSITGCTSLQTLALVSPKVTCAGVTGFDQMTKLTALRLGYSGVTDDGLKMIAKAPALTNLTLTDTKITGAGLPDLLPLKKLAVLDVNNTAADNAGLKKLEKLQTLRQVHAVDTKVTQAGADHYMAVVPNSIVWIKYPKITGIPTTGPIMRVPRDPTRAGSGP
jgi:hypothetical protein